MKKKLIVMDKDADLLELISFILREEGFEVKPTTTLDDLDAHIEAFVPDGILLDVIKPYEREANFCQKLKKSKKTKNIPVIVLSTSKHVAEALNAICADDVIEKPFDIFQLITTVKSAVAA